jgi:hypothetical protein
LSHETAATSCEAKMFETKMFTWTAERPTTAAPTTRPMRRTPGWRSEADESDGRGR